jgi:hypothetical protein
MFSSTPTSIPMHFPTIIKHGSDMETNPTISQGRELRSGMGSQQALSVLTVTHPLRLPFAQKQDLPRHSSSQCRRQTIFLEICLIAQAGLRLVDASSGKKGKLLSPSPRSTIHRTLPPLQRTRLEHNNIFGASYQFMDVCLLE